MKDYRDFLSDMDRDLDQIGVDYRTISDRDMELAYQECNGDSDCAVDLLAGDYPEIQNGIDEARRTAREERESDEQDFRGSQW